MTRSLNRPESARALVRVRLSGEADSVAELAERLAAHFEVLDVSAPYPNRRDPGVRRYLLINHTTQAGEPGPDAA